MKKFLTLVISLMVLVLAGCTSAKLSSLTKDDFPTEFAQYLEENNIKYDKLTENDRRAFKKLSNFNKDMLYLIKEFMKLEKLPKEESTKEASIIKSKIKLKQAQIPQLRKDTEFLFKKGLLTEETSLEINEWLDELNGVDLNYFDKFEDS